MQKKKECRLLRVRLFDLGDNKGEILTHLFLSLVDKHMRQHERKTGNVIASQGLISFYPRIGTRYTGRALYASTFLLYLSQYIVRNFKQY